MDAVTAGLITAGITAAAGVGGAAVGALLQASASARQWTRERAARREERQAKLDEDASARAKEAAFAALDLADALERYALACAHVVSDNGAALRYRDEDPRAEVWTNVPDLADFPSGIDWRALGVRETSEVRHFRSEVELAKVRLNAASDHLDGEDLVEDAADQAANLGKRAWQIAVELRTGHGLPAFHTDKLAWDYIDTIERLLNQRERERAQRRREAEEDRAARAASQV